MPQKAKRGRGTIMQHETFLFSVLLSVGVMLSVLTILVLVTVHLGNELLIVTAQLRKISRVTNLRAADSLNLPDKGFPSPQHIHAL